MKKYFLIITCFLLMACGGNNVVSDCFNNSIAPITLSLNSPQLNPILTPANSVVIGGGIQGIVITNSGTGGSFTPYRAVDLACPNRDCSQPMTVNYPTLQCPCDQSRYSLLDGSLQGGESNCNSARVYTVIEQGSSITISN